MKKLFLLTLLFSFILSINSYGQTGNEGETTTYYFIRHAEKDKSNKTNTNPKLIKKGKERAQKWAKYFKDIKFDAIYSTDYIRTKKTALPTAKQNNLDITLYSPTTLNYKLFLEDTKGKTVLIVGHSNSTPYFVNKILGEDKYQEMDETINNKLFIVTIVNENISHKVTIVE